MQHETILVVGGGNMAQAIMQGVAGAPKGQVPPVRWIIAEPDPAKHAELAAIPGVDRVVSGVGGLAAHRSDDRQVLLAVKPQVLGAVAETTRGWAFPGVVISILAGAPSHAVREAFGGRARVVRVMPNTPASIGRGMSCVAAGQGAEPSDTALARTIMSAVGDVIEVDESMVDAFTAVAGSGPAYLFYLAEGLERGARAAGFDEATARRVVAQTLVGAAELLASRGIDPRALRDAVTSKGGTTAAATAALDEARAMDAIERAVIAARDRGRELGR